MTQLIKLTGTKFGRLLVLEDLPSVYHTTKKGCKRSERWVKCECDCGKLLNVRANHLMTGNTSSCGCLKGRKTKHGMAYTTENTIWHGIKNRCNNKNHPQFHLYGGRGITICESWNNSFVEFFNDMGLRPSKKHSIDRIDNAKGYCKENCRWATRIEQSRNRRVTFKVTYNGKEMALADVADLTGQSYSRLYHRLRQGWTIEEALKYKRHAKRKYQNESVNRID